MSPENPARHRRRRIDRQRICRQTFALNPKHVILLDISEPQLYEIDRQLDQEAAQHGAEITVTPILGSIQNEGPIQDLPTSSRSTPSIMPPPTSMCLF